MHMTNMLKSLVLCKEQRNLFYSVKCDSEYGFLFHFVSVLDRVFSVSLRLSLKSSFPYLWCPTTGITSLCQWDKVFILKK